MFMYILKMMNCRINLAIVWLARPYILGQTPASFLNGPRLKVKTHPICHISVPSPLQLAGPRMDLDPSPPISRCGNVQMALKMILFYPWKSFRSCRPMGQFKYINDVCVAHLVHQVRHSPILFHGSVTFVLTCQVSPSRHVCLSL